MSIENPTVNKPNNDLKRKRNALEKIVETRIRGNIDAIIEENPETPMGPEIYLKGLRRFIKNIKRVVSDKDEELSELYNFIATQKLEDGEEFVKLVNKKITEFMMTSLGFDEIENISRRGKTMLNRLIEYKIENDKVSIHVPATFLENPSELRSLFIDAMKKLANKFKSDPEFKNVTRVFARSWIVFKSHEILEKKFGFTILSLEPKHNVGSAEITKEKLLQIYG